MPLETVCADDPRLSELHALAPSRVKTPAVQALARSARPANDRDEGALKLNMLERRQELARGARVLPGGDSVLKRGCQGQGGAPALTKMLPSLHSKQDALLRASACCEGTQPRHALEAASCPRCCTRATASWCACRVYISAPPHANAGRPCQVVSGKLLVGKRCAESSVNAESPICDHLCQHSTTFLL
eukprot:352775-Chlamydomonas_euryale.AAC.7